MDGFPWNTFKLTLLSASQGAKRLTSHISITVDISAEAQHTAFGTWEPYGSGWRGPSLLPALQTQTKPLKHSEIHCPCPTDEAIDIRSVVLGVLGESVWSEAWSRQCPALISPLLFSGSDTVQRTWWKTRQMQAPCSYSRMLDSLQLRRLSFLSLLQCGHQKLPVVLKHEQYDQCDRGVKLQLCYLLRI